MIWALARGLVPGGGWLVLGAALYTNVPLFAFIARRGWRSYPRAAFRLLVVRPVLYAQLLLPFVAAAGAVGLVVGVPLHAPLAAGRAAAGGLLVLAICVLIVGYVESRRLVLREIVARVPGLPVEFDGLCIVQLSDLHVGPQTSRWFLRRVVRSALAAHPDIIAVTGDMVDDQPGDVEPYAASLGALSAPLGVYLTPGNHDVYAGWAAVHAALRTRTDGRVLVNESHLVRRGGATLALVGIGDPAGGGRGETTAAPDVDRAFAGVPRGVTVVALAHNPALWPQLVERGAALTLSGHTHWGQFALPKLGWSLASPFVPFAMGVYQNGDSLLYITPGTGYWGIPFRLGAPPEVTRITLRRAEKAGLDVS